MPGKILENADYLRATDSLIHAVNELESVGITATWMTAPEITQAQANIPAIEATIERRIRAKYPRATPTDEAIDTIPQWLRKALEKGYRIDTNAEVQSAFADFILALRTAGFKDKDTTGTQMGNFQGGWRGGGYAGDR